MVKVFLSVLGAWIALVLLLVAAFAFYPGWFIRPGTLEWLARHSSSLGVQVGWKDVTVDARRVPPLKHLYTFVFGDLCVRTIQEKTLRACFAKSSWSVELELLHFVPHVRAIGPIRAEGGAIEIRTQPSAEAGQAAGTGAPQGRFGLPRFLEKTELRPIFIDVPSLLIRTPTDRWKGKVTAQTHVVKGRARIGLDTRLKVEDKIIDGTANVSVSPGFDRIQAEVDARFVRWIPDISVLRVRGCHLDIERQPYGAYPDHFRLSCPVDLKLPRPRDKLLRAAEPEKIRTRLDADFRSSELFLSGTSKIDGEASLQLEPSQTPVFIWDGAVRSRLRATLDEITSGQGMDLSVDVRLKIPKFEKVVSRLSGSHFDIPAPLRVLNGEVVVRASGQTDLREGAFPIRMKTKLSSASQRLNADADAQLELKPTELFVDLILQNVKLELPELGLEAPPRLLPDSRLRPLSEELGARKKKGKSEFTYRLRIRTAPGKPALVTTNLAKAPVPVETDLNLSTTTALQGSVHVGTVPIQFFRRQATLDHLNLDLTENLDRSPVDSLVRIPYSDYTLLFQITGLFGKPRVIFNSDPPMPQDQLLAQLLFGTPPDNLTPDQSLTVGSAQTAFSQGAISLASLFFLASTPIQSLGYNPETGELVGTVRIAEGTGFTFGTQTGGLMLGLQKRLGPHWSVSTQLESAAPDTTDRVGTAYLQWGARY